MKIPRASFLSLLILFLTPLASADIKVGPSGQISVTRTEVIDGELKDTGKPLFQLNRKQVVINRNLDFAELVSTIKLEKKTPTKVYVDAVAVQGLFAKITLKIIDPELPVTKLNRGTFEFYAIKDREKIKLFTDRMKDLTEKQLNANIVVTETLKYREVPKAYRDFDLDASTPTTVPAGTNLLIHWKLDLSLDSLPGMVFTNSTAPDLTQWKTVTDATPETWTPVDQR